MADHRVLSVTRRYAPDWCVTIEGTEGYDTIVRDINGAYWTARVEMFLEEVRGAQPRHVRILIPRQGPFETYADLMAHRQ